MKKFVKALILVLALGGFAQSAAHAGNFSQNKLTAVEKATQNASNSFQQYQPRIRLAQNSGRRISPSAALRAAKRVAPGSQALGVRFIPRRQGYIVTLKTRGRIRRVFVNARNGRVGR